MLVQRAGWHHHCLAALRVPGHRAAAVAAEHGREMPALGWIVSPYRFLAAQPAELVQPDQEVCGMRAARELAAPAAVTVLQNPQVATDLIAHRTQRQLPLTTLSAIGLFSRETVDWAIRGQCKK